MVNSPTDLFMQIPKLGLERRLSRWEHCCSRGWILQHLLSPCLCLSLFLSHNGFNLKTLSF